MTVTQANVLKYKIKYYRQSNKRYQYNIYMCRYMDYKI